MRFNKGITMLFKSNRPNLDKIKCESADEFLARGGEIQTSFHKECKGRKDMNQKGSEAIEAKAKKVVKNAGFSNNADDYKQRKLRGF